MGYRDPGARAPCTCIHVGHAAGQLDPVVGRLHGAQGPVADGEATAGAEAHVAQGGRSLVRVTVFVFLRTEAKGHMIAEGRLITLLENIKRKVEDKKEYFRDRKRNWDEIAMLGG